MKRGLTGRYIPLSSAAGEKARAFVPNPLPPSPPLELDAEIQELIQNAMLALGRLDGLTTVLPDPEIFLYSYRVNLALDFVVRLVGITADIACDFRLVQNQIYLCHFGNYF